MELIEPEPHHGRKKPELRRQARQMDLDNLVTASLRRASRKNFEFPLDPGELKVGQAVPPEVPGSKSNEALAESETARAGKKRGTRLTKQRSSIPKKRPPKITSGATAGKREISDRLEFDVLSDLTRADNTEKPLFN